MKRLETLKKWSNVVAHAQCVRKPTHPASILCQSPWCVTAPPSPRPLAAAFALACWLCRCHHCARISLKKASVPWVSHRPGLQAPSPLAPCLSWLDVVSCEWQSRRRHVIGFLQDPVLHTESGRWKPAEVEQRAKDPAVVVVWLRLGWLRVAS